jgi:ribosomal protein S18 acetylase RimI-like enzyme
MYTVRSLTDSDVNRLTEINPTFTAHTRIHVERRGDDPFAGWHLREDPLASPFHKGRAYDFDAHERQQIRGRLQKASTLIELVEDQGRLVGILDMEEESWRQSAWVWNLMLDVDVRGQGLGRRLVQRAIDWSRDRGLRAILLETQSNNTPACHFYAHMGFQLVGIHDWFYSNDDMQRNEIALFWGYRL